MAALTSTEIQELITALNRNATPQTWSRPQVTAALQAVEDRVQLASTQNAIGGDIETAVPGVFSAAQKKTLFGVWCVSAARRLGVL